MDKLNWSLVNYTDLPGQHITLSDLSTIGTMLMNDTDYGLINITLHQGNTGLHTRPMIEASFMNIVRLVCEVCLSLPLAVLGIIGNILAFVVLCRQKQRVSTTVLLQALAVTDTLVLISSILTVVEVLH